MTRRELTTIFFKFLEGKGSKLIRILGANPSLEELVKFQNLHLLVKQWAKDNEEDRIKFFMYVHAPDNLKKNKEHFGLRYDEFLRRVKSICNAEEKGYFEHAKNFTCENPQRFKQNKKYPNKQK